MHDRILRHSNIRPCKGNGYARTFRADVEGEDGGHKRNYFIAETILAIPDFFRAAFFGWIMCFLAAMSMAL